MIPKCESASVQGIFEIGGLAPAPFQKRGGKAGRVKPEDVAKRRME
jgi:hypothetical protein